MSRTPELFQATARVPRKGRGCPDLGRRRPLETGTPGCRTSTMPNLRFRILLCTAALALATSAASAQTKLLRFPDIYKDKVVFTYAGDLWVSPAAGGSAVR